MSASSFFRKLAMELDGGASVGKGLGFPAASVHWGMVDGGLPCRVVLRSTSWLWWQFLLIPAKPAPSTSPTCLELGKDRPTILV